VRNVAIKQKQRFQNQTRTTRTKFGEIGSLWTSGSATTMLDTTICNVFPYDKTMLLWVTVTGESGTTYYIVSDTLRQEYYLYKGKKKTAKKSSNPMDLYKYVK
jgi:hypothetical protein